MVHWPALVVTIPPPLNVDLRAPLVAARWDESKQASKAKLLFALFVDTV